MKKLSMVLGIAMIGLVGCTTNPATGQEELTETGMDAVVGGVIGAGVGAIADAEVGRGALIGAIGGAAVGTVVSEISKEHEEDQ